MRISLTAVLVSLLLGLCLASISAAKGQDVVAAQDAVVTTSPTTSRDESWYREQQEAKADARAIVQQKAQERAFQRQTRMACMSWYGMSNARPTAASTPFTARYSPVWEMPGGKPYSWYPQSRPGYVMYWR